MKILYRRVSTLEAAAYRQLVEQALASRGLATETDLTKSQRKACLRRAIKAAKRSAPAGAVVRRRRARR